MLLVPPAAVVVSAIGLQKDGAKLLAILGLLIGAATCLLVLGPMVLC